MTLGIVGTLAGVGITMEVAEALFGSAADTSANIDWDSARLVLEAEIAELDRARLATASGESAAIVATSSWAEVRQQISEIRNRLRKNVYAFDVFEVDSFNYGLMVTHRQTWEPGPYQAGRLAASIPLAPGEKRQVTTKRTQQDNAERRQRSSTALGLTTERSTTTRAEEEILQKAAANSSFDATVSGSFKIADVGTIGGNTKIGAAAATETTRTQNSFREAVMKAASDYRREHEIEVTTGRETTTERSTTGEISNPNNEITVTYLYYELQRQYTISEQLREVTPYVFVARHVPAPHEVDVDFLVVHAWILRKVALEPGLIEVLDYLEDEYVGDATRLDYLRDRWEVARDLVQRLSYQLETLRRSTDAVRDEVSSAMLTQGEKEGMFEDVAEFLFGGTDESSSREAAQAAAERSMEYITSDLQDVTARLVAATDSFSQATADLAESAAVHANWKLRIDQTRVHVKENILWYMHSIWDHEVPDQRFFEFYDKQVLVPQPPSGSVKFGPAGSGLVQGMSQSLASARSKVSKTIGLYEKVGSNRQPLESILPAPDLRLDAPVWAKLVDIADLNEPVYVGNMVGFPLTEHNYLTFWMASQYLDDELGVSNPDPFAELDLDDLLDHIDCGSLTEADRHELVELLVDKLHSPKRDRDTIVVPTGELFVESLPGTHPVLEHFKLEHRKIDLARAALAAAGEEVETIRRSARVLTGDFADFDVDRVIHIDGHGALPVISVDGDEPTPEPEPTS